MATNDKTAVLDAETMAQTIGNAVQAAIEATKPPKKVEFDEYRNRPGKREPIIRTEAGTIRQVYQNGQRIQIKGTSDATVKRLAALKPGAYFDGLIRVEVKREADYERVDIRYACSTVDERVQVYQKVSSFSDLVKQIAKQQEGGDPVTEATNDVE